MIYLASVGPWQIILLILAVALLLLPIIALVDILSNEFTDSNKLIWVLVVLFLPFFGSILYFILGTKQKVKP